MKKTPSVCLALVLALATSSCVVEVPKDSVTPPPSAGNPTRPNTSSTPELRTRSNGDIEVIFKGGCVCLFDRYGNLKEGGRSCDDLDLHRARQAVKAHLAEQSADFSDV